MQTEEQTLHPRVHVEAMTIQGAPEMEESITARIGDRLPEVGFEGDSGWLDTLEETAKEVLQNNGYLLARVSAKVQVLSSDSADEWVSVHFQLAPGQQYRLGEIKFAGAHVFSSSELRSRVRLDDGQVFDLGKIRQGLDAWKRLYDSVGYVNFVADPDIEIEDNHQLISVLVRLQEGDQFRVGSIQVLGLDQISSQVLKMKLRPGDIFNSQFVEDFYSDNTSLFPPDASRRDTKIKQDGARGTVAIVFDASPCRETSSQ